MKIQVKEVLMEEFKLCSKPRMGALSAEMNSTRKSTVPEIIQQKEVALNSKQVFSLNASHVFLIDSGTSSHLLRAVLEPGLDRPVTIIIANGQNVTAEKREKSRGKCQRNILNIEKGFVPWLEHNLLSVGEITKMGNTVSLNDRNLYVDRVLNPSVGTLAGYTFSKSRHSWHCITVWFSVMVSYGTEDLVIPR